MGPDAGLELRPPEAEHSRVWQFPVSSEQSMKAGHKFLLGASIIVVGVFTLLAEWRKHKRAAPHGG